MTSCFDVSPNCTTNVVVAWGRLAGKGWLYIMNACRLPFTASVDETCYFGQYMKFYSIIQVPRRPCYGRPLSVSGRPCYILPMFFFMVAYSPALVNGCSRKFYTWWTLSVIREVSSQIFSWSPLNYRVGQKVTKFGVFSDRTRKLSALTPERGRIL